MSPTTFAVRCLHSFVFLLTHPSSSQTLFLVKHFLFLYLYYVLFQKGFKIRRQTFSKHPGPDAQNCARCCGKCKREHILFFLFFFFFLPSVEITIHLGRQDPLRRQLTNNSTVLGTGSLDTWVLTPSSTTRQLCDLEKVTSPLWASVSLQVK